MAESIIIYRKDGTPVDVSAYVSQMQINKGDVTGFGEAGFEGVAHTLSLTLQNAKEINFSPFAEKGANISEYVNITGTGAKIYTASSNIYPETVMTDTEGLAVWLSGTNFVFSRNIAVGEVVRVMYTKYDLTVYNPINRYNNAYNPLLEEMSAIEVFRNQTAIQSKRVTLTGNGTKRITVTDEILAETVMTEDGSCGATYIPASNEIEFSRIIAVGESINVLYSYQTGTKLCIFSGYVGNSINISEDNSNITLTCSDKAYRLQKAYIDNVLYNIIRTYAVEKVLAETLIQNTLDDIFGAGQITLYTPAASGQLIEITSNEWGGKTVWDMIQGIASAIGWVIGYEYNSTTAKFELTFKSVPRNKTVANYTLDYKENLLSLPVDMSGTEIYNKMLLYYTDTTAGAVKYVSSVNAASVSSYGARIGIIKESETVGINNAEQAQLLADSIVSDVCEKVVTGTITIPLDTKYNFFDIIAINYPKLSNSIEYFVVESIQHTWDYAGRKFETVLAGNKQKVRGGTLRWTDKVTRPSKMEQITNRDVGTASPMKKPSDLTVVESGIEKLNLASQAYAILSWVRPLGEYPGRYELELKKSADTWTKAEKYSIIPSEIAGSAILSQKVTLSTGTAYDFRVTAIDTSGKRGEVSDNAQINSIGDNVAPATVTGLSVTAGVKQLIVKFNPSAESDFLKYRIYYYKTGNTPIYKETASTVTTIDNLDTTPYNVYVTALDTSNNESTPTSTLTATPILVNDDVFAEIRDKTLHIKTAAQMTQWVNSIADTGGTITDVTALYNTVMIYDTIGEYSLTKGLYIKCLANFSIIGVGSPVINITSTLGKEIEIKSYGLTMNNVKLKTTWTSTSRTFMRLSPFRTASEEVFYNLDISSCDFIENLETNDAFVSITLDNDNDKGILNIKNNNFINCYYPLILSSTNSTTAFIEGNKFKNSNTGAGDSYHPMRNYLSVSGNFGKLKINSNEFENTGISQYNGIADNLSVNFNEFKLNYALTQNLTQNIIDAGIGTTYSYKQCVMTGNVIKSSQSNSSYISTIKFIKSYRDFIYGQIYNNTFMKDTYSNFGAWLDAGEKLTTGTIIANNTDN